MQDQDLLNTYHGQCNIIILAVLARISIGRELQIVRYLNELIQFPVLQITL